MKKVSFLSSWLLLVIGVWCLTGLQAQEESGAQKEIRARIDKFYGHYNAGEYKEAFDLIMIPSSGYLMKGELIQIPDEKTRDSIVQHLTEMKEKGYSEKSELRNVEILVGEEGALVTYIAVSDATTTEGKQAHYQTCSSEVWLKNGEEWKLFHWHFSELKPMEEKKEEGE